jgi:hypothetical protein
MPGTIWDVVLPGAVILIFGIAIYSRFKNQPLRETTAEIRDWIKARIGEMRNNG